MKSTTELIRTIRAFGLSQTEIARRTGIPQPRVSRWERGDGTDGPDDALRLAGLLGELRAMAPPTETPDTPPIPSADEPAQRRAA